MSTNDARMRLENAVEEIEDCATALHTAHEAAVEVREILKSVFASGYELPEIVTALTDTAHLLSAVKSSEVWAKTVRHDIGEAS
ncbi:MAG: hypothetical protein V4515_14515 [Chloroflexota bacterium]